MATTRNHKIGRTRVKLARMLNEQFPEYDFRPENIDSQIPIYASAMFDYCSWSAMGYKRGTSLALAHVASWDTMTDICRRGIAVVAHDLHDIEICCAS